MRVLITGCSSGFGWGAAVELTKRGHEVIATARRPEIVAQVIADVVESDAPAFRNPVGDDAEMVFAARGQMDDATFEATMRETLELDW